MIPLSDVTWQTLSWQELIKNAISDVSLLLETLELPHQQHYSEFPIKVPAPFLHRMKRANPKDPLLLQVLSQAQEMVTAPGFVDLPLEESEFSPLPGLIQKYQSRALIIVSGACAIHCRYCFRRHFPYDSFQPDSQQWSMLLNHIAKDESIEEVILSGGDPLMISDRRLAWIFNELSQIDHLKTIRLHTRLPVVVPQRITPPLLALMESSRLNLVLVNHINHANEIDEAVIEAMRQLKSSGVTLLNQSVLLKQVNDSAPALVNLSKALFQAHILPYYLHLLDPVNGSAHFEVKKNVALELMEELRKLLPGYLVPKLAQEIPGAASKHHIA